MTPPGDDPRSFANRISLRQLRYFVAVAEERHFRRAAERLHMTQPPLSHQIQLLERRLGVQLMERNRRRVTLTDEGEVFLADARSVLARLEEAVERVRASAAGVRGDLRLGFVGSSAVDLVPAITKRFHLDHPRVRLTLREVTTIDGLAALASEDLDAAVVRDPPHRDGVRTICLREEPFVLALPEAHPLASRPVLTLASLRDLPLILHPQPLSPRYTDRMLARCRSAGFVPRVAQEAVHLHTHLSLVAAGVGGSLLPKVVAALPRPGVVLVPLDEPDFLTRTYLAWREANTSPVMVHLTKAAAAVAGEGDPTVDAALAGQGQDPLPERPDVPPA